MAGRNDGVDRRRPAPMLIGETEPETSRSDRPRIASEGRFIGPADETPPDPRAVIDDLRRRLRIEQEKSLNSVDAVLGARAVAAQAKAETQEVLYRLHVRETELRQLKEILVEQQPTGETGLGDDAGSGGSGGVEPAGRPLGPGTAFRQLLGAIRRSVTSP